MMTAWLLAALAAATPATDRGSCIPATPPAAAIGTVDPFHAPAPKATELNSAGKTYYRDGKWEEARIEYRAAVDADPAFLAPRLNVACSFVRQERLAEATAEVEALLKAAYVPWVREVMEAADLGALKPRPEMAQIRRAMTAAAMAWGAGLDDAILFVGRARAPLKVPETGAGFFILNPHQEVYAFLPSTGLYRQLTNEDGRVLAMAQSPDHRRVIYVTADRLIRGAKPDDLALRGVTICELTLATMTSEPPIKIEGDVRRLTVNHLGATVTFSIEGDRTSGMFRRGEGGRLDSIPPFARARLAMALTPRGTKEIGGPPPVVGPSACRVLAQDIGPASKLSAPGKPHMVFLFVRGRIVRRIGEQFGAGLSGLPIP